MHNLRKNATLLITFLLISVTLSGISIANEKENDYLNSRCEDEDRYDDIKTHIFDKDNFNTKKIIPLDVNSDFDISYNVFEGDSSINTTEAQTFHKFGENKDTTGESVESVYTAPFYSQIFKKRDKRFVEIFVPSEYYTGKKRIENSKVTVEIKIKDPVEPLKPLYEPASDIEYLIITNDSFYETLNENFKDWKISNDDKINSVAIENLSDIIDNQEYWVNGSYGDATNSSGGNSWIPDGKEITDSYQIFNDTQCKIRNCIRDYTSNHNVSYVLLVGNKNYMPPRMVRTYAHSGPSGSWYNVTHASDMYFSCLDYCMNNNTNSLWMENNFDPGIYWADVSSWDEIDWGFDVTVGRVPASTITEVDRFINKTKAYTQSPHSLYHKYNIIANKDSDNNICTLVWDECADEFASNQSFLGNSTINQTTWSNLDDYCNGIIDGYDGFSVIHHAGHGGTLWNPYSVSNQNNSQIPNFVYTEGCDSGNFGDDTNSRAENWMSDDGSIFAGIMNSAFGWFTASTWYGEELWSQMFNETRGIKNLNFAKAHDDAREEVGYTAHSVCPMIYKETNFFGDPALEYVWYEPLPNNPPVISNETPANESTAVSTSITYQVNITDPNDDLIDWSIECSNGQSNSATDDTSGIKTLSLTLSETTTYTIWVNASDDEETTLDIFTFTTGASELWVDDDADPGWYNSTHFDNIPYAIDTIFNNGTIHVYNGTYTLTDELYIDRPMNLLGENREQTIIQRNGGNQHRVLTIEDIWDYYVTVDGFTFQGGYANMTNRNGIGGNILILNSLNATINNSIIKNGFAEQYGGGVQLEAGGNLKNSTVFDCNTLNSGMNGGGGGVSMRYDGNIVENCFITNCSAPVGGGILLKMGASPPYQNQIIHCTIANNTAHGYLSTYYGGGIASQGLGWTTSEILDSIIYHNSPNDIMDVDGSLNVYYSCTPSWGGSGSHNIASDPSFTFNGTCQDEEHYYLYSASPARATASDGTNMGVYQGLWYKQSPNFPPELGEPTPSNNSIEQPKSLTWIIPITDPNWNEYVNWTIECNNSMQNNGTNEAEGNKHIQLNDLSNYTEYTIWVNVTDGGSWTNGTYYFTTGNNTAPEKPQLLYPANKSNYVSVYLEKMNCSVSDSDGDKLTVYFYINNGTLIYNQTNVSNGIIEYNKQKPGQLWWLNHSEVYEWYVVVDDGSAQVQSEIWTFDTSQAPDTNEDKKVDIADISQTTRNYGISGMLPGEYPSDVNSDGSTDIADVSSVTGNYGVNY
jgi:hypothetical protein